METHSFFADEKKGQFFVANNVGKFRSSNLVVCFVLFFHILNT